jgi:hypothetical protein
MDQEESPGLPLHQRDVPRPSSDQHTYPPQYYPFETIDPRLLDRRLNPTPSDQTVFASGMQQPRDLNLEHLLQENRNPPLLPQIPVEHNFTEINSTLVHDLFALDVPQQGPHVPQFNCDDCSRTFSLRYELE